MLFSGGDEGAQNLRDAVVLSSRIARSFPSEASPATDSVALVEASCCRRAWVLASLVIQKQKAPARGALLFGGDEGARTHDLSDVNRTL